MALGFKPIQSVYFLFDGVTKNKKIIFDKFLTFHHEFFFLLFPRKELTSFERSYTSPFAKIKMDEERF